MANKGLTVQARALRRAADILGGKDELRAALRVPMPRLEEWLQGAALPPMDIFLKAVDIISTPSGPVQPAAIVARSRLLRHRSGELIANAERQVERARAVLQAAGARAVQSTPLVSVSGQVLGMLSTHYDRPHTPEEPELQIIDHIARRAAFWLGEAGA